MWRELGAVQERLMIDHDELMRVVGQDGRTFVAYCDPDRLEAHLHELSPADALASTPLPPACAASGVRHVGAAEKPRRIMSAADWLAFNRAVLPYLGTMARWGRFSARRFAERFQDPLLRAAWKLIFGWEDIPWSSACSCWPTWPTATPASRRRLARLRRAIARRYEASAARSTTRRRWRRSWSMAAEGTGLRLYDDSVHAADAVISAADGRNTLFGLLGEET
jgi:hypothetical protein